MQPAYPSMAIVPPPFAAPIPAPAPDFTTTIRCTGCDGHGWVEEPVRYRTAPWGTDPGYFDDVEVVDCDLCGGWRDLEVVGKLIRGEWWVIVRPLGSPRGWIAVGTRIGTCGTEDAARYGELSDDGEFNPDNPEHRAVAEAMGLHVFVGGGR